jgi:Cu(I)/Ag(I) efflux system membrane fusion protein
MDLTPLNSPETGGDAFDSGAILLSKEAVALANIQTTRVRRSRPVKEIRLYGILQANERLSHSLVSHVNGRIEKLYVNFAGENIRQGQVIASLYSPDLLNAQHELQEALRLQSVQPALLEAVREKLRRWKLTGAQIAAMERQENGSPLVDITAGAGGTVVAKKVAQGDYVATGSILFDLADFSSVWALFDAYEADLPSLKTGQTVAYTLPALPGKTFSGKITFIDPVLDKTTRTAKVRVETINPEGQLKPGMYANAVVRAAPEHDAEAVVIPKSAILWTGKRSIVYVRQPESGLPSFKLREIELGPSLGDAYVVVAGIAEGDEIVTNGVFSIDASAQLEGKQSMMNAPAEPVVTATLGVQGACEMCKERIEDAAKSVAGVIAASWDPETNGLRLSYDAGRASLEAVSKAIAAAGHDTDADRADDETYGALPPCCRYRG